MKISFEIDENDFPYTKKIDYINISKWAYNLFKIGYNTVHPKDNKTTSGLISNKIDKLDNVIENLLGIHSNSSKRGKFGEDYLFNLINKHHPEILLNKTRFLPHHGDAVLAFPQRINNNWRFRVMLEIKNYTKNVDEAEIDKLKYDMNYTGYRFAIITSLQSGFVNKHSLTYEQFKVKNKMKYIIFIPNLTSCIEKFELAIILINKLIKFEQDSKNEDLVVTTIGDSIKEDLKKLHTIYEDTSKLQMKYHKMETSIRNQLVEFGTDINYHHLEVKKQLNKIWDNINQKLDTKKWKVYQTNKIIFDDLGDKLKKEPRKKTFNKNLITLLNLINLQGFKIDHKKDKYISKIGEIHINGNKLTFIKKNPNLKLEFATRIKKTDIDLVKRLLKN